LEAADQNDKRFLFCTLKTKMPVCYCSRQASLYRQQLILLSGRRSANRRIYEPSGGEKAVLLWAIKFLTSI
jgi:hypothetical protein